MNFTLSEKCLGCRSADMQVPFGGVQVPCYACEKLLRLGSRGFFRFPRGVLGSTLGVSGSAFGVSGFVLGVLGCRFGARLGSVTWTILTVSTSAN